MSTTIYIGIPLMLVLAVLQTAVLPRFPIYGLVPQLPLLVALSWGLLHGVNESIQWSFLAGICVDLFTAGPLGVTALAFMAANTIALTVGGALPSNRFILPVLLGALATIISTFLYLLFMRILGTPITLRTWVTQLPLVLLHGGLILPVYWLMHSIERARRPRQIET